MKILSKNEGNFDRIFRVILSLVLFTVGFFWLTGTLQLVAFVVAAVSLITGITGFCGIYKIFGINTCSIKKRKS